MWYAFAKIVRGSVPCFGESHNHELLKDFHMKLKLDEKGQVALENGLPVWVADDGKEIAYDVPKLVEDMKRVNGESAGRRKDIDALNEKLKVFDGIDPAKYREMEEKLTSIDQGRLIEAGKVEELKANIAKGYDQRISEMQKAAADAEAKHKSEMDTVQGRIRNMAVRGLFERSEFLREKTVLPPEIAFASFGQNFTVEEDGDGYKISASLNGQPILSRAKPGEIASPEEALEAIIDAYQMKDRILKSPGGGAGTQGGSGGGAGGKTMLRADFEKLAPADQMAFIYKGDGRVVD